MKRPASSGENETPRIKRGVVHPEVRAPCGAAPPERRPLTNGISPPRTHAIAVRTATVAGDTRTVARNLALSAAGTGDTVLHEPVASFTPLKNPSQHSFSITTHRRWHEI